jgi:2-(1,2-epoxy-1,2-dihydrophenyl)acetyl-CoA isomerase
VAINDDLEPLMTGSHARIGVYGDGVAVLEILSPPNNFLSVELLAEVADGMEMADADERCRVIVLCSDGKNFCAGASLGAGTQPGSSPDGRHIYDEALRLFASRTPIVAALQGAAVGGGLGLALVADIRVAAEDARLYANFAALGFNQGFAISVTLPWVVGSQMANRILLEARRISGVDAARIGLVDKAVPAAELREAARALAAGIAANAPLAIRSIRETMRRDLVARVAEAIRHEREEQGRLRSTADFAEGVAAMSERRPPVFRGL